jgi:hypothetical protein
VLASSTGRSQAAETEGEPVQLAPAGMPGLFSYRLRSGHARSSRSAAANFTPSQHSALAGLARRTTLELRYDGGRHRRRLHVRPGPLRDVRMSVWPAIGDQTPTLLISLPRRLAMNEAVPQEDERALAYVVNSEREGISSVRLELRPRAARRERAALLGGRQEQVLRRRRADAPESQSRFGGLIANPLPAANAADMTVTLLPDPDGTFAFRSSSGRRSRSASPRSATASRT